MAITSIVGFEGLDDAPSYPNDYRFFNQYSFLPFAVHTVYGNFTGDFTFTSRSDGRPYLTLTANLKTSNNGNWMAAQKTPGMYTKFSTVFREHYKTSTRFYMGFRALFPDGNYLPDVLVYLYEDHTTTTGVYTKILDYERYHYQSQYATPRFYEIELDFEKETHTLWVDGVMIDVQQMHSSDVTAFADGKDLTIFFCRPMASLPNGYSGHTAMFSDFYFIADTKDDTPCGRLGAVEIGNFAVNTVNTPEGWQQPTEEDPNNLIDILNGQDHLTISTEMSVESDPNGSRMQLGFETPEVKEGDILYTSIKASGFRLLNRVVMLNSQVHLGPTDVEEKPHPLINDATNVAGDIYHVLESHTPVDGSEKWTEETIGDLTVDFYTTKPTLD